MTLRAETQGAFGIRVEGRDAGIIFSTVAEAVGGGRQLIGHGYIRVEIFERTSGAVIWRLSASDAA